eukprot:6469937-Amphidinium_carterae.2
MPGTVFICIVRNLIGSIFVQGGLSKTLSLVKRLRRLTGTLSTLRVFLALYSVYTGLDFETLSWHSTLSTRG